MFFFKSGNAALVTPCVLTNINYKQNSGYINIQHTVSCGLPAAVLYILGVITTRVALGHYLLYSTVSLPPVVYYIPEVLGALNFGPLR